MTDKTCWESFKVEGESVIDNIKGLIHEGNVRRVVVQHEDRTIAEFPLTAGVLGTVLAPVLAAVGALVALLKDCTIRIERVAQESAKQPETKAAVR
jgi:D-aminopeptidase